MKPFVVGIAGGTGSGKTTIAHKLAKHFGNRAVCIPHDSYYRDQSKLSLDDRMKINYDHPDSLETTLLIRHIRALVRGKSIQMPLYDFTQHNRSNKTLIVAPKSIIIIEGIHTFNDIKLREFMSLKVFVDTDADIRLGRRIVRDIQERGRTLEFSLHQYLTMSKPMHEAFVEPSKKYADIIIPEGGNNMTGISILTQFITQNSRREE